MLATRRRSLSLGSCHFGRHSTSSTQAARGSLTIRAKVTRPVAPLLFILSINGHFGSLAVAKPRAATFRLFWEFLMRITLAMPLVALLGVTLAAATASAQSPYPN